MSVRTRRWTRSPRGIIFGVATGLAEWRGLSVDSTRIIVLIITLFTGIFPLAAIYLALAVILPEQSEKDILTTSEWRDEGYSDTVFTEKRRKHSSRFRHEDSEDAVFHETTDEDLEKEYEELKKKVETMESDIFDREKDWDNRFNRD